MTDAESLNRARSAVLNVLMAAGVGIAASGALLRWRDRWAVERAPDNVGRGLMAVLFALVVLSFAVRRAWGGREALRDPETRAQRLVRASVASAALAAMAVPLGLAYGWFVRPQLDAVLPFWVAAIALGFLAFPRPSVLEGLDPTDPEGPSS